MADGGKEASDGAPVTSGVIMAAGGQHSDSQRLSKDLEDISAWHVTGIDCEEELQGEDEADLEKLPGDSKLQQDLLSHQYGDNTPSKERSRTLRSPVWNTVKRIKDKALLGPVCTDIARRSRPRGPTIDDCDVYNKQRRESKLEPKARAVYDNS
jgi:hypothetical protein